MTTILRGAYEANDFSGIVEKLLFIYLAPLQNDCLVTSRSMQFIFGDKGEVYLLDESALSLMEFFPSPFLSFSITLYCK